jgi:hypothetical protein
MVLTSIYGNINSLTMMAKRFMTIVDGSKKKHVASIIVGTQPLPLIGRGSTAKWENRDALASLDDLSSLTTLTI